MALKSGRPSEIKIEDQPRKFTREIKYSDGCRSIWTYDLDRQPNGPIEVEMIYPEGWDEKEAGKTEEKQYFNEKTGRYVAKFRAKQLGLI